MVTCMNTYMVCLATLLIAVWLCTRPARLRAAALREQRKSEFLAKGLCPTCEGNPFEHVLMNGLSGCLDCSSTGSAWKYRRLAGR